MRINTKGFCINCLNCNFDNENPLLDRQDDDGDDYQICQTCEDAENGCFVIRNESNAFYLHRDCEHWYCITVIVPSTDDEMWPNWAREIQKKCKIKGAELNVEIGNK